MNQSQWQHNPKWNGKFLWSNTLFLILTPLLTIFLLPWYIMEFGFHWVDFVLFFFLMKSSGLSITAGYHRLFSHQTYETNGLMKFLFLFFGAGAFQNSAIKWSSDHRYHHRFVDKEGDPYSITKGFFHAHMAWIFYADPEDRSYDNVKDLQKDPLVAFQHKYFLLIAIFSAFILPALVGMLWGRPLAAFLWAGLLRVVYVHHGTFLINSLAHTSGTRPYSIKNSARDNWWLAFFTNGEGYHNFHHAFANDYRNGLRWYQWDPTKWLILSLQKMSLAHDLKRTPEAVILRAKLEGALEQFSAKALPDQLESMRASLETKIQEFQVKIREFHAWKEAKIEDSHAWRKARARYWRRRLQAEKRLLENSVQEFKLLLELHSQGLQFSC